MTMTAKWTKVPSHYYELEKRFDGYDAGNGPEIVHTWRVQMYDDDGYAITTDAGVLDVLYCHNEGVVGGRIAITNNAGTVWGDCWGMDDVEAAIEECLNDYATFQARN